MALLEFTARLKKEQNSAQRPEKMLVFVLIFIFVAETSVPSQKVIIVVYFLPLTLQR